MGLADVGFRATDIMTNKRANVQLAPGHNAYLVAAHRKHVLVCSKIMPVEEEPEQFGSVLTLYTVGQ